MLNANDIKKFADYCDQNFDLSSSNSIVEYQSLPLCILDDVFSLQANYDVVVKPIIENYAKDFLKGNALVKGHTLTEFMNNVDSESDYITFTQKHLGRYNKSCGRLKIELCYELARNLRCLGIETIDDFQKYKYQDVIEIMIRGVKGLKDQAVNYLFMLAGDSSRVKVDTHITKSIIAVFGESLNNAEAQYLFSQAVICLSSKYPKLTVSRLDNIIWTYYHFKKS